MISSRSTLRVIAGAAIAFAMALPAQAGAIFDSLGPGNTFQNPQFVSLDESLTSAGNLGGLGPATYSDREWAWAFTVGSATTISSVDVALSLNSGENEVDLWIASDGGGIPGTILDLMHVSGGMVGGGGSVVSALSSSNPFLGPGTYYFGVSAGLPGVGGFATPNGMASSVGIKLNDTGATGSNMTLIDEGTQASPFDTWVQSSAGTIGAFRINGSMNMPEPATFALMSLGIAVLGAGRRRR